MARNRRAVSAAVRKRKRQQKANDNSPHGQLHDQPSDEVVVATSAVDLTEQNAVQSPLLRLPAELRNSIWKLAYSDRYINVSMHRFMPRGHYFLHFEGQAPDLVCKQHWAEVVLMFMQTCTFSFEDEDAFEEFLTTDSSIIAQVRRIAFQIDFSHYIKMSNAGNWVDLLRMMILLSKERLKGSHYSTTRWEDALIRISGLSDKLESLEGVQISAKSEPVKHWKSKPFDVSGDSNWEEVGMAEIVRFFQQYRLKRELTSYVVTRFEDHEEDLDRFAQLSAQVRDHLLDYMGYERMNVE